MYPYYFTFTTFTKGRWVGEKILDVFAREFRAHPVEEYVSDVPLWVCSCPAFTTAAAAATTTSFLENGSIPWEEKRRRKGGKREKERLYESWGKYDLQQEGNRHCCIAA